MTAPPHAPEHLPAASRPWRGWHWLRRIGLLVLTVAVVEYLVVPQLVRPAAS